MELINDFPAIVMALFFVVAFLYASVGHGGASGYLALMALLGVSPLIMKSSSLMLNIIVSAISFFMFYRGGFFRWKLFWPFAIASIPAAFLGASILIDGMVYKKILGIILLFPILRLIGVFGKGKNEDTIRELSLPIALTSGAVIGLLSGMIGIGGGIILSPLILIFKWANIKEAAAVSALFIFVNSVAGFAGVLMTGISFPEEVYYWIIAAVTGGFAGAFYGSFKGEYISLKIILAIVLIIASSKLIMI
jgi:uncharacterized protein